MHLHRSARTAQPVFVNGVEGKEVRIKHSRKAYRKHSSRRAMEAPGECVVINPQANNSTQPAHQ